ncbi:hypothetical protein AB0L13_39595 [Saccharopolyspora shandongensis]|uniref:hypothetical protein n=1 Tax=Saccharopolyspora shandongensis TaxID=418495 RepID=UPI0034164A39
MTDNDVADSEAAQQEFAGSGELDVQLAQDLSERAREQGVSLVGLERLLASGDVALLSCRDPGPA